MLFMNLGHLLLKARVFDFELTDANMTSLETLDTHHSLFLDHRGAQDVKRFVGFAR